MISRRDLLARAGAAGAGVGLAGLFGRPFFLAAAQENGADPPPATRVANPLRGAPDRGWERVYRDQFREDSSFVFTCAPNDTHNCLLRAHVKNGVVVRISPTHRYGDATDLEGNRASHRWDPAAARRASSSGAGSTATAA
jgi:nitrate reductase alpha subunit